MGVVNILMLSCLSICQVTLAQEEKHHIQLHKIPYGKALNLCDIELSTNSSIIYAMAESEWRVSSKIKMQILGKLCFIAKLSFAL